MAAAESARYGDNLEAIRATRVFAEEILVGWSGVLDGKGSEVPFSEAAKTKLLNVPAMASLLVEVYGESMRRERGKPSKR